MIELPNRSGVRLALKGDHGDGLLFSIVFAFLSADSYVGVPVLISNTVPTKHGSGLGRPTSRHFYASGADLDLHLSKSRLQQYLVRGPFGGDDPCIFRRWTGNDPTAKTSQRELEGPSSIPWSSIW